jgi:protein TonB
LLPVRRIAAPRRGDTWWAIPASALLHAAALAGALWLARPDPLPEPREAEPVAVLWEEAEEGQPGELGAPVGAPPLPPPAEVAPPPQPPVAAAPPVPEVARPPAPPRVAEVPPAPAPAQAPAPPVPPFRLPDPAPPPRLAEAPVPRPLDLPPPPAAPAPPAPQEPPRAEARPAEAATPAEATAEELPLPPPPPPPPPRAVAQQQPRPQQPAAPAAQPAPPAARPGTESAQAGTTSTPGRATGAVVPPGPDQRYVNASPRYPDQARALGQQGTVILLLQVGPDGRVTGLVVEQSSGSPTLDLAARRAALEWRFRPATQDGQPVAGQIRAPVTFRLN